ncbi:MAG: periplasmic heavy metal sensor [Armatimonadota bacterium]|nr:periplasmic heavy metal sensor [Armatimonadota bacterium]MDR7402864.1 periplasmic heavy metal sensor [Armatimonadota bacterium]MDR7438124.1 periplasmic heavy metal sensor [Armatimonadota bacterium]MDR7510176.1 periplasmic heavy metal sensor [Armatimonadota bacterium]
MAVSKLAWTACGLAAVLVLGAASGVLARPWGPPPADRLALTAPRLQQALGLTEDQARRLETALRRYRDRTARLRLDLARARLDLREVMLAERPDTARADEIARRIGALTAELIRARVALQAELREILTPDQRARLGALLRQRARRGR